MKKRKRYLVPSTLLKSHRNGYPSFALRSIRASQNFALLSELLRIALGAYAAFTRVKRAPRLILTGKQAPQKCREGPCTAFQSKARLYMDAVSMAKPRRRDVMGKENNSTSYEPSEVLCAFVFFFFSPSRGQIFGLSTQ